MHNLISGVKITQVSTAILAAGSTEHIGIAIDTSGYLTHTFMCSIGVIASTAATGYLKIQGGSSSGTATTDIAGSTAAVNADLPNSVLVTEIHRPKHRWLRPVFNRASANITVLGAWCLQSNAVETEVTQSTVVIDPTILVSPSTG